MTDAVSGAILVAQVIKRIMDLLARRAANFAAMDDLKLRMAAIQRVCDQISDLEASVGKDKIDLAFATDGVLSSLQRVEAYVSARLEERGGLKSNTGVKGALKKLSSVLSADGIAAELERLDVAMNRHLQVLSVAQGSVALNRQMALEAQIERLTKLSENMFALQMMASSMAPAAAAAPPPPVVTNSTARPGMRAVPMTPKRVRGGAAVVVRVRAEEEEEKYDSSDAEVEEEEDVGEPQPPEEVSLALGPGVEKRLVHNVQDVEATGPRRARVYVDDPPEAVADALEATGGGASEEAVHAVALASAAVAAAGGARPMGANAQAFVRYLEIVGHQFITCTLTGALALILIDTPARVSMVLFIPMMPVLYTLLVAWYAAGGMGMAFKPLLRTAWTIYLMYGTPCVCGVIFLALKGALDAEDAKAAFRQYLCGGMIGIALFIMSRWLAAGA